MERIELFDSYINNQLSDAQRSEFDERLKTDEVFASNFMVYLMTVGGICREARQNDMDFGVAMKKLTKEQLREIIGPRNEAEKAVAISAPDAAIAKPRVIRFKPWIWQVASIAAVVVIAFTVVFNIQKQYQNALYDNIYASAQFEQYSTRGQSVFVDITKLNDSELKAKLPEMEQSYQESTDYEELYQTGYSLAMAYIRLHKPEPALIILTNLVSKLQDDNDYEPEVREMRLIIKMLE